MTNSPPDFPFNVAEQQLRWELACLAIALLKQDPSGLKGILVAASHGPVYQAFQARIEETFRITPVPVSVSEERLAGSLDITETLAQRRSVFRPGLLSTREGALLINGAERLSTTITGMLSAHLDTVDRISTNTVLVAFDESLQDEPGLIDTSLEDRLALLVVLPDLPWQALQESLAETQANHTTMTDADKQQSARSIGDVDLPDEFVRELTLIAAQMGIDSMRPVLFAARVAKGHAYLSSRTEVTIEDAAVAVQLVLAPRARQLPERPADRQEQTSEETQTNPDSDDVSDASDQDSSVDEPDEPTADTPSPQVEEQVPEDSASDQIDDTEQTHDIGEQLLEAANATLPEHLIAAMVKGQKSGKAAGRDSQASSSGTQGRPAGVRRPRGGSGRYRLNIIETLKTAAPKQRLRGNHYSSEGASNRLQIRTEDFRVTRYKQPTRTTTVFVVDASGSSALNRLAEAKGAVELLLAESYVRRDRVAMISFRGHSASLELPPTRSLVRAKRQLAGLPGGGGTPLAAGIDLAVQVVRQLKQAGETPVLVFMTDAKANIARDGSASRTSALEDVDQAARQLAHQNIRTLFIDTSPRPRAQAAELAKLMRASYMPLPHSGSVKLSALITSS